MADRGRFYLFRRALGITQQAVADIVGVSREAVAQWESKDEHKRTEPEIKHLKIFIAYLEKEKGMVNVPIGWFVDPGRNPDLSILDHMVFPASSGKNVHRLVVASKLPAPEDTINIPQMNAVASMGRGIYRPEYDAIVGNLPVDRRWLQTNISSVSSVNNLVTITAFGDSMLPTFAHGDVLLVDTGVQEPTMDAIYVFSKEEQLFIKRIHRKLDGSITIKSDNTSLHEPENLMPKDFESMGFRILGRVCCALCVKRL